MPNLDDSNSVNISNGRRNEKAEGSIYTNRKVRCASTKLPQKNTNQVHFRREGWGEKEGASEGERDRQTDRQAGRQAGRQTDRQTDSDRQSDRERQTDRDR